MKFSKSLRRISDAMNPTWAPYWPNYKLLKKLINEIPMCPAYAASIGKSDATGRSQRCIRIEDRSIGPVKNRIPTRIITSSPTSDSSSAKTTSSSLPQTLLRIPGEVLFFKVLHGELRKTKYFFGQVSKEIQYHEELVKAELDEILNLRERTTMIPSTTAAHNRQDENDDKNALLINRWNTLAKSIYQLYNTCMCLETYAIMCYCSFSKILKKHDKVSGFDTKEAFILKVVQNANFFHYPELIATISSMQALYEQVSQEIMIIMEGKGQQKQSHNRRHRVSSIHDEEDGQLFIDMIQRLNQQESGRSRPSIVVDGDASSSRFDCNGSSDDGGGGNQSSHQTAAAVVVHNKEGLLCQDTFPGKLSTIRCLVEASAISTNDSKKKGQGSSSQDEETSATMTSLVDVINQFSATERMIADQQQEEAQGIGPPKSATAVIRTETGDTTTTTTRKMGTTTPSSNNSNSPRRRNKKRNRSTQQDRGGGESMRNNKKSARLSKDDDDDITDFVPTANE